MNSVRITTLFVDIGNVLLTNGWDRDARKKAAHTFGVDYAEMDERHHLMLDIYSSCFVHFRKPDPGIFLLAMDCARAKPEEIAYIDDRGLFVEAAGRLGIHGIHHTGAEATRGALEAPGLSIRPGQA